MVVEDFSAGRDSSPTPSFSATWYCAELSETRESLSLSARLEEQTLPMVTLFRHFTDHRTSSSLGGRQKLLGGPPAGPTDEGTRTGLPTHPGRENAGS